MNTPSSLRQTTLAVLAAGALVALPSTGSAWEDSPAGGGTCGCGCGESYTYTYHAAQWEDRDPETDEYPPNYITEEGCNENSCFGDS